MNRSLPFAGAVRVSFAFAAFLVAATMQSIVPDFACGGEPPVSTTTPVSAAGRSAESSPAQAAPPNVVIQLRPVGGASNSPVVTALALDPRGEFVVAAGDDHAIRVLRTLTLAHVTNLSGHGDWVQSIDISPDGGTLVSVGNDGRVITWDRDNDWEAAVRMSDMPALRSVRFSPTSQMIAMVGFAPELYLLGLKDNIRPTLNCGCRDLRSVDFRGDGKVVATAGRSGDVHLFDAVTGSTIDDVRLHSRRIRAVRFIAQTNRLFTVGEDGHLIVYDVDSQQVIHDLTVVDCKLMTGCMIGSSHVAVGGSDNLIRIFDIRNGALVEELAGHTGTIADLKSSDGMLYSAGFDTTVRRWNVRGLLAGETVADAGEELAPVIRTSRLP